MRNTNREIYVEGNTCRAWEIRKENYTRIKILAEHGVERSSEESGEKVGPEQDVEEDLQSKII